MESSVIIITIIISRQGLRDASTQCFTNTLQSQSVTCHVCCECQKVGVTRGVGAGRLPPIRRPKVRFRR